MALPLRGSTASAFAFLALGGLGCTHIPEGKRAVTDVTLRGTKHVDDGDLEDKLATRKTPKFLLLFRGIVYEYETYDRYTLERDLARIERYYRARGYYQARVRAARVHDDGDEKVEIEIHVDEGEPVRVERVIVDWHDNPDEPGSAARIPPNIRAEAERLTREAAGRAQRRFDEDQFKDGEDALVKALANRGYAYAAVTRDADVDVARNQAVLSYHVVAGEQAVFGPVTFSGLDEIPERPVRSTLDIQPGKPYSAKELEEGQQALLDLGVFASVDIVPDLASEEREPGGQRRRIVPVHVQTELGKLRSVKLGGGLEINTSKVDFHARGEWSDLNTLGGLRRVNITFRPGIVLFPNTVQHLFTKPEAILPFQRTRFELTRPSFLESRTTGLFSAEYGITPQLFPKPEQMGNVIGYHDPSAKTGVRRAFGRFVAQPTYGINANIPYNAYGQAPEHLNIITISYLEFLSYLDLRNNPLRPMRGAYVASTLQFAGLGGSAIDARIQPEARGYIPLGKRVSIGVRAALGFVFPQNYGDAARERNANLAAPIAADHADLSRDYQILYFRGLFGGGPSSNRGYPARGIGPHDRIPYLVPAVSNTRGQNDCDTNPDQSVCQQPTGGLSQWESSLELRFNVSGPLLAATFCDAGDVSPEPLLRGSVGDAIRFDRLHLSCGAGARYDTPAGPIRLDVGVRIPGMQTLGNNTNEVEPSTLFGLPIALSFGIGEAF